jgi:hypothetical protein
MVKDGTPIAYTKHPFARRDGRAEGYDLSVRHTRRWTGVGSFLGATTNSTAVAVCRRGADDRYMRFGELGGDEVSGVPRRPVSEESLDDPPTVSFYSLSGESLDDPSAVSAREVLISTIDSPTRIRAI